MTKYFILLVLFIASPFFLTAQKNQIQWGSVNKAETENGKNFFSKQMVGSIGDNYFMYASTRKNKHLLKFNSKNNLTETTLIDFKYQDKKIDLINLLNTASSNFLVSTRHYPKTKENKYFINEISADGTVSENVKELFSHRYIRDKNMRDQQMSEEDNDVSGIWTSSDSTKVLFVSVESKYQFNKKKGDDIFHFALFDSGMNLIWQEALGFPYTDKKIKVEGFSLTNDGKIFAHGKIEADEKRKFKMPQTNISLFEIKQSGIIEIEQLKIQNKYLGGGYLYVSNSGPLYYAGTYVDKKEKSGAWGGLYLFKFDDSGNEIFNKTYKWSNQVKKEMDSKKWYLNFKNGLIDYENEAVTIAIENITYKIYKGKTYLKGTDQIILSSFSFDGESRWMTLIQKEFAAAETPKASSFLFAHKDENIYLIFNDDKNKEERKKLSATRNPFKSSYFMDLTKINSKGEIELRETLINSKEFEFYFDGSESSFIENGKVLIFGEGNVNSDFRIGTIELN